MYTLITLTEVAQLLGVCEKTVRRMVDDGRLPRPIMLGNRPRFSRDAIMRHLAEPNAVGAGITFATHYGSIYCVIVKADLQARHAGRLYAAFTLEGAMHLRPWLTYVIDDVPGHEPFLLSCEDTDVPEVGIHEVPCLASIAWEV